MEPWETTDRFVDEPRASGNPEDPSPALKDHRPQPQLFLLASKSREGYCAGAVADRKLSAGRTSSWLARLGPSAPWQCWALHCHWLRLHSEGLGLPAQHFGLYLSQAAPRPGHAGNLMQLAARTLSGALCVFHLCSWKAFGSGCFRIPIKQHCLFKPGAAERDQVLAASCERTQTTASSGRLFPPLDQSHGFVWWLMGAGPA